MTHDRHILLPIDLHPISRDKLETVVRIAGLLQRSVLGLMLEDLQLQQVADLPFTTEITLSGARERNLLRDELTQRGQRINTSTRQALQELASRNTVNLSFEQASGHRMHCALELDGDQDIFFPPRKTWQHPRQKQHGAGFTVPRLGLVLPSRALAARVIDLAALLLQAGLVGEVHAIAAGDASIADLNGLPLRGRRLAVHTGTALDSASILLLIRRSPYDLLLIPRQCLATLSPHDLDAALAVASGQVMVIGKA